MSSSPANARVERQIREDSEAFLARWKAEGGYEGACAKHGIRPVLGHMPFPGHRKMSEIG